MARAVVVGDNPVSCVCVGGEGVGAWRGTALEGVEPPLVGMATLTLTPRSHCSHSLGVLLKSDEKIEMITVVVVAVLQS